MDDDVIVIMLHGLTGCPNMRSRRSVQRGWSRVEGKGFGSGLG